MGSIYNQEIINYLLGKIDPAKEDNFLATCFSSDENAEQFEIVREDLIESYLRGNLSEEDKVCFKNYFLKDPQHRELFIFAGAIREQLADNKKLATKFVAETSQINEKKPLLAGNWFFPIAALGTLLIGVFFTFQLFQKNQREIVQVNDTTQTPTPINSQNSTPIITPTPTKTETPNAKFTPTVSPTPKPTITPMPTVTPNQSNQIKKEKVTFAFMLPLGSKGGDEDILVIKKEYDFISLETDYPEEKYRKYKIDIKKNGKVLWGKTLKSLPKKGDGFTAIKVPADKFKNGKHKFVISGIKADGTTEKLEATENFFSVRREDK